MKKRSLDIVLFGIDNYSNIVLKSLIDAGHQIKLVVCHNYDEESYEQLKKTCANNNISINRYAKINSEEVISAVKVAKPDICVIAHFERIIRKELLSIPPMGFINLHPSLLPNYRGLAPQHWPIINGESKTGITVHYVDEGTDTGDIILQRVFDLPDNLYVAELQNIWKEQYKTIMVEAINNIIDEKPTISQNGKTGSFYEKMKDEPYPLSRDWSVKTAYNWVRAMSLPYNGVICDNLQIFKAHILEEDENIDDEPVIQFKDGTLVIDWYDEI